MHEEELATLKDTVKKEKRRLPSTPHAQRPEKEAQLARLELALKRAESTVNRETRLRVEQEALDKAGKDEREKRKQGKGKWFMKPGA